VGYANATLSFTYVPADFDAGLLIKDLFDE
jgi:hypothetical protein